MKDNFKDMIKENKVYSKKGQEPGFVQSRRLRSCDSNPGSA